MFRVVVQDSRVTPTSGKIVALLGSYDPHAKTTTLDKEKAAKFLTNGAQPTDRAAALLKSEGVDLPGWVTVNGEKAGKLRNPEKLRKNQPKEELQAEEPAIEEAPAEAAAEAPAAEETKEEA
jgi:small subunit ribosomal protein S16